MRVVGRSRSRAAWHRLPRRVDGGSKPGEHRGDDPVAALAAELERGGQESGEARAERSPAAAGGRGGSASSRSPAGSTGMRRSRRCSGPRPRAARTRCGTRRAARPPPPSSSRRSSPLPARRSGSGWSRGHRPDRSWPRLRPSARVTVLERDHAAPAAHPAERLVRDDPGEPGRELVRADELIEAGIGTHVGLLNARPRPRRRFAGCCAPGGTGGGCGGA